ncbi:hypothetical protein BHM03_00001072 [Ensete ventricosum]|uniref:Uncharacterized protein n=1 Tax=Ensete ventricosum TaxID=4639 RepID=A0A445M8X5_ENSVE|nr:hypothetical protein BHM03_00001072 [Ensete ventricosum]
MICTRPITESLRGDSSRESSLFALDCQSTRTLMDSSSKSVKLPRYRSTRADLSVCRTKPEIGPRYRNPRTAFNARYQNATSAIHVRRQLDSSHEQDAWSNIGSATSFRMIVMARFVPHVRRLAGTSIVHTLVARIGPTRKPSPPMLELTLSTRPVHLCPS